MVARLEKWGHEFEMGVVGQNDTMLRVGARTGNKFAMQYTNAFKKLREYGDAGREALCVLLEHPRPDVRTMAAAFLLRDRTDEAMAVLRGAAAGKGVVALGATMTIKGWEEGTWALDPEEPEQS